jgi:sporulation protein YlmC with PRC-barrel domain
MKIKLLLILGVFVCLAGCSAVGPLGQPQSGAGYSITPGSAAVQTEPVEPTEATVTEQSGQAEPLQSTEQSGQTEPLQSTEPAEQAQPPQAATPAAGSISVPATGAVVQIPTSALLDYQVTDANGNLLGKVKDLVINRGLANGAGSIPYIIVESSLKEDWEIPVPWKNIQIRPGTQTLVVPANASQLAAAPGFGKDSWPASFASAGTALQSFWANPAQAAASTAPLFPAGAVNQAADTIRAKDLLDLKVTSPQGIKLGKIKDLAIDWQNSQPGASVNAARFGYVLLSVDDNLNPSSPMIPIPYRLVQIMPQQETLVLNIAPAAIPTLPNFSQGSWPDLYSAPWNAQLAQFWANK